MIEDRSPFWVAGWHLGLAVGRGHLRDRRGLLVSLLTPLGMLLIFWLALRDRPWLVAALLPAVMAMAVMLAGSAESTRLASWREQGVLARLACSPTPLVYILLSGAGVQALVGAGQGIAILVVGVWLLGMPVEVTATMGTIVALMLGSACFTAYGALIAQFANRAESANALFVFSILPMYVVGAGLPILPAGLSSLGVWLPTGVLVQSITAFLGVTGSQPLPWLPLLGLGGYTLLFGAAATRFFRLS